MHLGKYDKKKILFYIVAIAMLGTSALLYADETITVTTYLPSPIAVYNTLKLTPRDTEPTACDVSVEGLIYYTTGDLLKICINTGSGYKWRTIAGSSDDFYWERTEGTPAYLYPRTDTDFVSTGTSSPPPQKLSMDVDGGIIAKGTYTGTDGVLSTSGAGARLIWYPEKAAFRAGTVSGNVWDDTNIGNYSVAFACDNKAKGDNSVTFGGQRNTAEYSYSTVTGGKNNIVGTEKDTIVGGESNETGGGIAVIVGGYDNTIVSDGGSFGLNTIGGGYQNTIDKGPMSTISGGYDNDTVSKGTTVSGGYTNSAAGADSVVSGGQSNTTGPADWCTVSGGFNNTASGTSATVSGGESNKALFFKATISGGKNNEVKNKPNSTILGGLNNRMDSPSSVIAGGSSNSIGPSTTVGGAIITGGSDNVVMAPGSWAVGKNMNITSTSVQDTFLWGYDENNPVVAGAGSQYSFIIATGVVGIGRVPVSDAGIPNQLLDVDGDINVSGDLRQGGNVYTGPYCGDGACTSPETCSSCAGDCGACASFGCVKEDGFCDSANGESCSTCPEDCGPCGSGADYVFESDYYLLPLGELRDFVFEKKHLPNLPSAKVVRKRGIDIFEQNRLLLEKIEEAHLYIFKLEERIEGLENKVQASRSKGIN